MSLYENPARVIHFIVSIFSLLASISSLFHLPQKTFDSQFIHHEIWTNSLSIKYY